MKKIELEPHIYLIEDFLTYRECEDFIFWSEQIGYDEAKVNFRGEQKMMKAVRNNLRITFTDFNLANVIWAKFQPFAFTPFKNANAIGLNEMFRFYKYEAGQQFKKHIDGNFIRNETEASFFTLLIYLNDNYTGGQTTFQLHSIQPKKGTALVFYHGMKHAGEEVLSGIKYVLRTDVMYSLINKTGT